MGNQGAKDLRKQWPTSNNPNLELLKENILSKYRFEGDYKFNVTKKGAFTPKNGYFQGLRNELLEEILLWLEVKDLLNVSCCSKYCSELIHRDDFWKMYTTSFFVQNEEDFKKAKKANWKQVFFRTFYPLYLVNYEDVSLDQVIGRGGSGATIYKAKVKKKFLVKEWGTKFVAFKVFKIKDIFRSNHSYDDFSKELSFLCTLHHPNILRIFGCSLKTIRVGIIVSLCENKSIAEYMKNANKGENKKLTFEQKERALIGCARGMNYMHLRRVIHKDLKCDNVLLTKDFTAKVFDFGTCEFYDPFSALLRNRNISYVGTARYIAPEVVLGKNFNFKVDVFAFSIMLFEVLTENFRPYGEQQNIEKLVACDENMRPKIDVKDYPDQKYMVQLMKKCWSHDPTKRPSFRQIIKSLKNHEPPKPELPGRSKRPGARRRVIEM